MVGLRFGVGVWWWGRGQTRTQRRSRDLFPLFGQITIQMVDKQELFAAAWAVRRRTKAPPPLDRVVLRIRPSEGFCCVLQRERPPGLAPSRRTGGHRSQVVGPCSGARRAARLQTGGGRYRSVQGALTRAQARRGGPQSAPPLTASVPHQASGDDEFACLAYANAAHGLLSPEQLAPVLSHRGSEGQLAEMLRNKNYPLRMGRPQWVRILPTEPGDYLVSPTPAHTDLLRRLPDGQAQSWATELSWRPRSTCKAFFHARSSSCTARPSPKTRTVAAKRKATRKRKRRQDDS